ncbi:FHIPEP family type III secretion protein [Actinoplanes sp. CA-131856]
MSADELLGRWTELFAVTGAAPDPASWPPAAAPSAPGPEPLQLDIPELFARAADPAERRDLDLLCAVLAGYPGGGLRLAVIGPQQLRARSTPGVAGLTAADLPVPAGGAPCWAGVALLRMRRRARVTQITESIDQLCGALDYPRDPEGSTAVALAVLDRLEILVGTSGVGVSVAGAAGGAGLDHVFTAGPPEPRGDRPLSREADFVVLRSGPPRRRRAEARSIVDLRRQHALAEIGQAPSEIGEEQTFAARVIRSRQDARARLAVRKLGEDSSGAAEVLREALLVADGQRPLLEGLASRIGTVTDFWLLDDALAEAGDGDAGEHLAADALRRDLDARLEQLLGLTFVPDGETELVPVVTPIVLEVADNLVPYVDSQQDGGVFLHTLIPAMRERIRESTGVTVPGVRLRGNTGFGPGELAVLIDELRAFSGYTDPDWRFDAVPAGFGPPNPGEFHSPVHPLTGEPDVWTIAPGDALDVQQMLIHRLELVLRTRLSGFVGPEEVTELLLPSWGAGGDTLDTEARLRLTWLLQAMLDDGLPISDGPAILAAVDLTDPLPVLRRAVREPLAESLPGRHLEGRWHWLPAELEEVLDSVAWQGPVEDHYQERADLEHWIDATIAGNGPVLGVVTSGETARQALSDILRARHGFVVTRTDEERT